MKSCTNTRKTLDPVWCLTLKVVVWFGAIVTNHKLGRLIPNRGMIRVCIISSWHRYLGKIFQKSRAPPKFYCCKKTFLLDRPDHRGTILYRTILYPVLMVIYELLFCLYNNIAVKYPEILQQS